MIVFQTLFSRICSDYCSAGLSSVTKTITISMEPGGTKEKELDTLTSASSLENTLSFVKRSAGFVGWV